MRRLLFPVLACFLLALTACSKSDSSKPVAVATEHKPAPDISVVSISDGATLKLSELRGKVVLLNFWATWCPPCREEIPSMIKLNKAMAGKPFQMVAVSIDEGGKPAIESFFKTDGFSELPVYIDTDNKAANAYGITGVPETFIIDKNGIIVKKVIGPLGWDSPDVQSFLEDLLK